jgi:hypothetical protein
MSSFEDVVDLYNYIYEKDPQARVKILYEILPQIMQGKYLYK